MKYSLILLFICVYQIQSFSQTPKKIRSNKLYTNNNQVFTRDSTPLNGYYKIKYVDPVSDWKKEITYFKNGFRHGTSKILRFNKLEEKGIYVDGVKHGTWEEYYYFSGKLRKTTHYKNGLKNGIEFGDRILSGYYICNYVNGLIEGALIKYDFSGYLESKEYYEKGKKMYQYDYDELMNITKEIKFSKNKKVYSSEHKRYSNNDTYIDSLFYNEDVELTKKYSPLNKRIPFKVKKYKNDKLLLQKEINIKKDKTRGGNNYILTCDYNNYTSKKQLSVSIYYRYSSIEEIQKSLLNYDSLYNSSCDYDMPFLFIDFNKLYLCSK